MTIGLDGALDDAVWTEEGCLPTTCPLFFVSFACTVGAVMGGRSLSFRRAERSGGGEEYRKHLGTIIVFKEGKVPLESLKLERMLSSNTSGGRCAE